MSAIDDFLDGAPEDQSGSSAAPAKKPASEIDQFLKDAPSKARGLKGWTQDVASTAVMGAIAVPEIAVGLADLATGGEAGKVLENEGGTVGFRPKQAREIVNDWRSEATLDAQRKFQEADGIVDKAVTAVQNPSLIATAVGESLPAMGAGGMTARGLMAATRLGQMGTKGAAVAGALGEGVAMTGSAAEAIRQESDDGLLTPGQSSAAVGTGLAGTVIGVGGNRLAQRWGVGDVDTMLAQGRAGVRKELTEGAQQRAVKSIPRQIIEGAIAEGFLEELPQSVAEQVFQNLALDRPWYQDVDSAIVLGTLSGGAMGGGAAGYRALLRPSSAADPAAPPAASEAQPNPGLERVHQAYAAQLRALQEQEAGRGPGPQTTPPDGAAVLAYQQGLEEQQRQAQLAASRAVTGPDDEILESTGATTRVPPSRAAGLNPDAGGLEGAAALALDTGATRSVQAQQRAQTLTDAIDPDTGEVKTETDMSSWSDEQLSDVFRNAQDRGVRRQLATELSRRRTERTQAELQAELQAEQSAPADPVAPDDTFARTSEDAGPVPDIIQIQPRASRGFTPQTQGPNNAAQANQAQQAKTQPTQAGGAPAGVAAAAAAASGAQGAGAVGQGPAAVSAVSAPNIERAGAAWAGMPAAQRQAVAAALPGVSPIVQRNLAGAEWENLNADLQLKLAAAIVPQTAQPQVAAQVVAEAAHEAATSPLNNLPQPTEAQKEAGNYKKGHVVINGLDITIENAAGTQRRPEWPPLQNHYGYFKGSVGADKDHVDVFLTDRAGDANLPVFVVDQVNKNGSFDEHKVVMGTASESEARQAYLGNYEPGWMGLGAIKQMSLDEFKAWVIDPAQTKKPVAVPRVVLVKPAQAQKAKDVPPPSSAMSDADFTANLDAYVPMYRELAAKREGNPDYYGTDLAKELFPEYGTSIESRRDNNDAVQPRAAIIAFEAFKQRLQPPAAEGDAGAYLMAGGPGSGKTKTRPATGIVYDSTSSNPVAVRRNVKLILDSGRDVEYRYVFTRPESAFRAAIKRGQGEAGRQVNLDPMVSTHAGAYNVAQLLMRDYAGDPRVTFYLLDNTDFARREIANLPPYDYNGLRERLTEILNAEYQAGRVSAEEYRVIAKSAPPSLETESSRGLQTSADRRPEQSQGLVAPAGAGDAPATTGRSTAISLNLRDKTVKDMTEEELQRALMQFGRDGKRTPKIRKEMKLRGITPDPVTEALLAARLELDDGVTPGKWIKKVSGLNDVMVDIISAPGEPVRARVRAMRMGGDVAQVEAEGLPAILENIEKMGAGLEEYRRREAEKMKAQGGQALPAPDGQDGQLTFFEASPEGFANALQEVSEAEDERAAAIFGGPEGETTNHSSAEKLGLVTVQEAKRRLAEWKAAAQAQGQTGANANRTVLSLFDVSGEWSKPWVEAGYNVVQFDLQNGEEQDIKKFSAEMLLEEFGNDDIWAILAAPPCTDFSSSGAQYWAKKDADGRTEASNELVRQTLRTVELLRPPVWSMENPVGRIAKLNNLPKPTLTFNPNAYGDPYTKKTMLWGSFSTDLPLAPVEATEGSKITTKISSANKNARTMTPEGFAYAFFMANNAEAMAPDARLAREFAGVDRELFAAALAAGKEERAIRTLIEDSYYDADLEAVRAALREAGKPDPQPGSEAAAPAADAVTSAQKKSAAREMERSLYRELSAAPDMVGKSIEELAAAINARVAGQSDLEMIDATRATQLARAIQKQIAKNAKALEKARHRLPEVYQAAVDGAAEGISEPAARERFSAGFAHAMGGKTKSTLVGDMLADQIKGYEAAQAWMQTEEGAAWYEGRAVNKLRNTGIDLRRHWEQLQAQMKAGESDIQKAWKQIERATARADLFAPLLPPGVSPGFQLYVTEVRGGVITFKEWLEERHARWYGSQAFRSRRGSSAKSNIEYILDGKRYPYELNENDRQKFETDEAYRAQYLRDAAADYLAKIKKLISFLDGKSSVKEAAEAFDDLYIDKDAVAAKDGEKATKSNYSVLTKDAEKLASRYAGLWTKHATDFAKLRSGSMWTETLIEKETTIALPKRSDALSPPKLDRVTREGLTDQRKGADVTPADFKKTFGFADVGFGKWVGSKQDQDHLNYAYDSFMDLANHFGTSPKNIGFGGQLHFTIGALGRGKASAHFWASQPHPEGGTVSVINLTNTKGDGTVYHEWIHAIDHFLGGDWEDRVRPRMVNLLTKKTATPADVEATAKRFITGGSYFKGDKRATKVDAAIRGLQYYRTNRKTTVYKSNADKLGKDYWGNEHELIARAAEAWAADTLGGTNTYLVNPEWVGEGKATPEKGYRGTPYPTGAERKLFAEVYDALAKSVKWEKGRPTVSMADFEAALPDSITAGERRRADLMQKKNMEEFAEELQRAQAERAMAATEDRLAKQREEQDELDRIAAEKLAELETIDPPQPDQTAGPLAEDDISAIFDQAAAELREETQEQPDVPAPGEPTESVATAPKAPAVEQDLPADVRERAEKLLAKTEAMANPKPAADKGAAALMAEAAKMGVKGADEALKGLSALFGKPGRLNSFPGGFDEETYQQAKPHFEAALQAFQAAGKSLKDLFKLLIQQFGDGVKEYAVRFAKDQNLTANLGSQPSASAQVADVVAKRLQNGSGLDWRTLFDIADMAFGGTQAEGKYTPKDAYDALEMGINKYLMTEQGRAFNPDANPEAAKLTMAALERVLTMVPTQTKRTAEQDEFQQFSTVPPLAYAANWVANITPADIMLEPSAGIGGLAAFAKNAGANLMLNELSSRRAAVLQELFPSAKVWTENAEQLHNILPEGATPSVVVMNPPFSASAGRLQGQRDTQLGGQHVEQALLRLAPGGRLVAIVGEGMAMDKAAFKDWWAKIGAKYDVRAVIPMDGKGYAKYGTTFDNVLFVIDKVAPSGRPVVTTKVTAYTELVDLLSEIRNDRPDARIPAQDRDGIESASAESARLDDLQAGEGDAGAGIAGPGGADLLGQGQPAGGAAVGRGPGGRSGGGRKGRSAGNAVEPAAAGNVAGTDAERGRDAAAAPAGGSDTAGVTITSTAAKAGELTESIFESYSLQRLQVPGAKPHPGPLVQSASMASVLPPAATYTPKLPTKTVKNGLLSIAQIEAVVYAGQAHSETLGSGERRGFFIGDGTGVGKGREIGGIILDNLMQGRKKAVWISEKQGLMIDAKRDFKGLGGDDTLIFNQNKTKAEDSLPAGDGILFTTYSTLRSGAQSQAFTDKAKKALLDAAYPKGSQHTFKTKNGAEIEVQIERIDHKSQKFVVTNLSSYRSGLNAQFFQLAEIDGNPEWLSPTAAKAKKAGQSRLDQLVSWLGEDYDGVIAFDEAHNAGNAVAMKGERGASEPSAQALAVVELQKRLPKARVVYVSATGATTVSNLSYATRLGLWGPGTPFPGVQNFVAEMTAGGLATMELVARDMKQMGAYIARSLSFEGVTYSRVEHELTTLQQEIYDRVAEAWQITLQNMDKALEVTGGKDSGAAKSAAKSAFWGAQQRFFNQIITSMQMPAVLEQMEADIANGDALVLQLVNTNEAQQNRAIAKRKEDDESTDLEDLDLTPRDQLLQMVEKSFPVVQYEKYTDDNGKTQSRPVLDSEGNPVQSREAVEMRDRLLEDLRQIRVPDGPLEIILNHFGVDKVAEVTGRTQRVVRKPNADGEVKAQLETRGASSARADAESFLADKKQILLFSDAGGTGFSFHADLTKPNQRKRKHYLIQPGWRADKAVQGFGRTHRTNQKSAPHYYLASTNIPAQKRFLSAIARRLDQLGALTKGQRDTANQGMFSEKDNLESKFATQAVRQLIDDTRVGRVPGLNFKDFLRQTGLEDIVNADTGQIAEEKYPTTRLFLNRMLSLKLDMQEKVFAAFIERMEEKVEMAAQRGELDAGMETIRALESKVIADEVIYTDPRTGAETRYVELELTQPTRFYDFPIVANESKELSWVKNIKSGKVYAKIRSGDETLKSGALVERFRMRGTGGTQFKNELQLQTAGPQATHIEITEKEARELWAAENQAKPKTYTESTHMIVGAMLPIWDRMKTEGGIRVARTQTTDGQRLLGRVIAAKDVPEIRKRLNIKSSASKLPPADVMARILKGDTGELANGWTMVRARVSDDLRIELKAGYLSELAKRELTGLGVVLERIQWQERYFIPTGKAGVPVLEALFKTKPLVDLISPDTAQFGGDIAPAGGTPTDRAVMDMVREGRKAPDILGLVAGTSKSRFNRQVARLLMKAGVNPAVRYETADLGSGGGFKFLAKYSRKNDAVSLTDGAQAQAEHIFMHETMHAATLRALDRKGVASVQMRKLYEHVKKQGGAAGQYGMKNVGEFVAEVFTNHEFQRAIKDMRAPAGNSLKSAWDAFVQILRAVLGLPRDSNNALSQALELGVALIREDMALRNRGMQARGRADAFAGQYDNLTDADRQLANLFGGPLEKRGAKKRLAADELAPADLVPQGGTDQTNTPAFKKWFGDSKVVDNQGKPMVVYHGTASDNITEFLPQATGNGPNTERSEALVDWFRRLKSENGRMGYMSFRSGTFFSPDPKYAGNYTGENGGVMYPVYIKAENPVYMDQRTGQVTGVDPNKTPDALIMRDGDKINEVAVIDPTQIKSAIGNNGTFDPEDPDISYFGTADLAGLKTSALDQIQQILSAPGKVSLWDKTIGTMRNLAERMPAFKPVFENAQRFLDDVSTLANDAADVAPRLLPRVESWQDLTKKPITPEDNKAIARPIFEGTLMWGRDTDGKAVPVADLAAKYRPLPAMEKARILQARGMVDERVLKMWQGLPLEQYEATVNTSFENRMLKPGVVWTAQELKDLFKLTDQQASLYQEARAAINRSIDMTTRTDILRGLGDEYAHMRDVVMEQETLADVQALLGRMLQEDAKIRPDEQARLMELNQIVVSRYERAKQLMDEGYAPLSRFGRYTVDVVDLNGERQYFGMFETMREANQMALRMKSVFEGGTVTQGTMSEEAYKQFAGITPESLELFGNMLGLDSTGNEEKDKAFQSYLRLAKNNHSALKRLIHRKGIAGYSEDVGRVLASFVYSNARLGAGGLNAGTMETAISNIPKEQGELKDLAMGLRDYIQNPQEEGQAVRSMLFAQYLGGSLASAFVNTTQPFTVTLPWLSQFGGIRKAGAQMARALKDMARSQTDKGFKYEPALANALRHAEADGVVSPQEIHQLMAQARGAGALRTGDGTRAGNLRAQVGNQWEKAKVLWGQPFALAEQFNRRSTFIAAFRTAQEQGMESPAEFARKAVLETQFLYSKANKMRFARGAVGGTLMTFKTYSVSYLELMNRMWTQGGPEGKRAVGWAVAMLLLMGGAGGLPFMEDAEDLIDGGGQLMGYNLSTKQWRKELLADVLGKEFANFMENGVSGLPGAPIDISGRLGMGNLIPGTGLLLSKQNRERDLLEVAGPAGDLVARGFTGGRKLLTGDLGGAALEVTPVAVRNAVKGADMAATGMYTDTKGYKVIDTTLGEAASKFLGFQPKTVAATQEAAGYMVRNRAFYTQTSSEIKAQWADALFRKDEAALERVRRRLADWNAQNPDQRIVVKMPDVWKRVREMGKDREERIADTSPKALRQQMREIANAQN